MKAIKKYYSECESRDVDQKWRPFSVKADKMEKEKKRVIRAVFAQGEDAALPSFWTEASSLHCLKQGHSSSSEYTHSLIVISFSIEEALQKLIFFRIKANLSHVVGGLL